MSPVLSRMSHARTTSLAAAAAAALAIPAVAEAAPQGPPQNSFFSAFALSQLLPNLDPPAVNNWNCRPTPEHPRPVVLVHGTFENRYNNWAYASRVIKNAGYCVFALDYGRDTSSLVGVVPAVKATANIRRSAAELNAYVDRVREATGAAQVDIVGHSQGGMMPRVYLKYEGGANPEDPSKNEVRRLVALAPTNHGTTLSGIATLAAQFRLLGAGRVLLGPAAIQQTVESGFTQELNAGGETFPGIDYTNIVTRYDEVSTPYPTAYLAAGPGATVNNIRVQDGCVSDRPDHLALSYDPRAITYALNALDPEHPRPVPCVATNPLFTPTNLAVRSEAKTIAATRGTAR